MLGGAQVLGGQWKDQGSPGRAAGGSVLGKGVRTGSQVHPPPGTLHRAVTIQVFF